MTTLITTINNKEEERENLINEENKISFENILIIAEKNFFNAFYYNTQESILNNYIKRIDSNFNKKNLILCLYKELYISLDNKDLYDKFFDNTYYVDTLCLFGFLYKQEIYKIINQFINSHVPNIKLHVGSQYFCYCGTKNKQYNLLVLCRVEKLPIELIRYLSYFLPDFFYIL